MRAMRLPELQDVFFVGFGHKARQGKDTCAWMCVDALRAKGIDARKYAFADALKVYARVSRGMEEKDSKLLQELGVKMRSKPYAPEFWLHKVLWQIHEESPAVAVLSDVRFPNELDLVNKHGVSVRVTRDVVAQDRSVTHISETLLDGARFKYSVANTGTLEELREQVQMLTEVILSKHYRRK